MRNSETRASCFLNVIALGAFSTVLIFVSMSQAGFFDREVSKTQLEIVLNGAASFLDSTQIRDNAGRGQNINGEWANFIYPLTITPYVLRDDDRLLIPDSNMFVTAAILYPLYWINDKDGILDQMRTSALKSIETYKRSEAFSFWPQYRNTKSGKILVGPLNFRVDEVIISNSKPAAWASKVLGHFMPWVEQWMTEIMNAAKNPEQMASFFNVPNDADDTAVAMGSFAVNAISKGGGHAPDLAPLNVITRFRDINRIKQDPRDTWTQKNSGAFLTWLKDENLPTFGDSLSGVMPMGVNNVDCVVNANVLFALAMNGQKEAPGFVETASYLSKVVQESRWLKQCALYYPQEYTFAYSVTRAYRDAEAQTPELDVSMNQLMRDLLEKQTTSGSWLSKADGTAHYSTAMALVALLNLGEERATKLNLANQYRVALERGMALLNVEKKVRGSTRGDFQVKGFSWSPGLFFSAEDLRLGGWRSTALSNAIVIEAIAKYTTNYHQSSIGFREWIKKPKNILVIKFKK